MYKFKNLISNLRAILNVITFNFKVFIVKYLHIIKAYINTVKWTYSL